MKADSDGARRPENRAPIALKVECRRLNTFLYDYTKNIVRGHVPRDASARQRLPPSLARASASRPTARAGRSSLVSR